MPSVFRLGWMAEHNVVTSDIDDGEPFPTDGDIRQRSFLNNI